MISASAFRRRSRVAADIPPATPPMMTTLMFLPSLRQAQKELLEFVGGGVAVDRGVLNALRETRRDQGEGGGVEGLAHGRHLHHDVLARATLLEHAHNGAELAVGALQSLGDGVDLGLVLQDVDYFGVRHLSTFLLSGASQPE